MLVLYVREHCPFCEVVVEAGRKLGVEFDVVLDIGDSVVRSELIMRGGKAQVPYFRDTERGVEMYESADIVRYLKEMRR